MCTDECPARVGPILTELHNNNSQPSRGLVRQDEVLLVPLLVLEGDLLSHAQLLPLLEIGLGGVLEVEGAGEESSD